MELIDFVEEQMQEFARSLVPASVERKGNNLHMHLPVGDGMEIIVECEYRSGTVNYTAKGKTFTFDRYGHNASFYPDLDTEASIKDLRKVFMEQIDRVREAQRKMADMNPCNLGPVTIMMSPEQVNEMVDTLKAGRIFTYTPAHMGRGYRFSIMRINNRFDHAKASRELELLVGAKVFITEFDAD